MTRQRQKGEYRLLILDGHESHINTAVIQYAVQQKIILLCLPSHTTHMIQPLDVSLFQPLSTVYRAALTDFLDRARGYTVDKVDFLKLYLPARRKALNEQNIRSAWRKSGLYPYQPNIVLNKWFPQYVPSDPRSSERPITPPDALVTVQGSNGDVVKLLLRTPADIAQVDEFIRRYKDTLEPTTFEKLGRACKLAIANKAIVELDNQCLVTAAQRKKERASRKKDHHGNARVLGQEHIDAMQKAKTAEEKKKYKDKLEREREAVIGPAFKLFITWENTGFKAIKQHDSQAARSRTEEGKAYDKSLFEPFRYFVAWCETPQKSPTKSRSPKKQQRAPIPNSLPPSPSPSPRMIVPGPLACLQAPPPLPNTAPDPTKQQETQVIAGTRRSGRIRRPNTQRIRI